MSERIKNERKRSVSDLKRFAVGSSKLWMSSHIKNTKLNLHVFIFKNVNVRSKKLKMIVKFTKCESD